MDIRQQISSAKQKVSDAESDLDLALRAIEHLPREQKQGISKVVEDAFTRLRAVRLELAVLQEQLQNSPP